ncbi:ABC transporter permease subunit [Bradyrhizobium diazoefficiens]|uniref:ABC transmembrane type-1 domain-containing protein n=1 Tax=Bradyrhizobium diazoefficiens SEMIA 5080 TaxID=754504 RepID=A0A837CGV8_9BRAD|nr:ABC transporter permease subunit [Bradyrhizobium diazoefficiens]APO55348.1 hypothetical protein BD122_33720 [Bradyrhizobium diazoefficiens]KGJ68161.1 hypothetical protein BJA5080_00941 [Bradyrhizobium diazoefficiens SEMIA 5080]KOY04873.1 hypothetical protein AF336_39705 [Bradyrhizobium diazoefficiens]MCD9298007.1 ABC transporter permease subunit [Bradyrhizobium diazoefficiens]MCD9815528.1 ABC transporter permease subunit [Bradyrhizobium diazoefficiens]
MPLVTIMGLYFAGMLSGAFVVETVFAWPGLGRIVVEAVFARDYPVVQAGEHWESPDSSPGKFALVTFPRLSPRLNLALEYFFGGILMVQKVSLTVTELDGSQV